MIQSQSLGGPPPDSGGGAKGGDGDYNRRNPTPPSHRPEPGEHRVHRHDSRDPGSNPALRDWRRPSRTHDVSRRDDRGFKDRWKDRKRWEKPRPRDRIRDTYRENPRDPSRDSVPDYRDSLRDISRDSARGPPEYSRSRISYDDDRREDRRRSSLQRAPEPRRDQAKSSSANLPYSTLRRESYGDARVSKKFSKRPGDKFRDLMMGTDKTIRPHGSTNSLRSPKDISPLTGPDVSEKSPAGPVKDDFNTVQKVFEQPREPPKKLPEERMDAYDLNFSKKPVEEGFKERKTGTSQETNKYPNKESTQEDLFGDANMEPKEPTKQPNEKPMNQVTQDAPKESIKEAPKEATQEAAKEAPKEAPKEATQESTKEAPKEAPKEATQEALKEAYKETTKETTNETAQEPSTETSNEAIHDSVEEASKDAAMESINGALQKPNAEPMKGPLNGTVNDSVNQSTDEPAQEFNDKSVKGPTNEQTKDTTKDVASDDTDSAANKVPLQGSSSQRNSVSSVKNSPSPKVSPIPNVSQKPTNVSKDANSEYVESGKHLERIAFETVKKPMARIAPKFSGPTPKAKSEQAIDNGTQTNPDSASNHPNEAHGSPVPEDFTDVDTHDSIKGETKPLSDVKPDQAEARKMLPQELEFHDNLVKEFSGIREKIEPAKYANKVWSIPAPKGAVVNNVADSERKLEADISARYEESALHKDRWLKVTSELESESFNEKNDGQNKSKSVSLSNSKTQQQAPGAHSRKRSRDEDSTSSSANRRNRDRHSRAHGDVARSEAEFLEILASLEAQTARDPLVRARLTSAHIPNQNQRPFNDRFCSTNALVSDHTSLLKRLERDAIDNFTADQHSKFIDAYVQFPKEFGKIADLVGRSFNDCVMHYYRTKKEADYKRILMQRTKKKRGRKPRKRVEDESAPSTPVIPATPTAGDDLLSTSSATSASAEPAFVNPVAENPTGEVLSNIPKNVDSTKRDQLVPAKSPQPDAVAPQPASAKSPDSRSTTETTLLEDRTMPLSIEKSDTPKRGNSSIADSSVTTIQSTSPKEIQHPSALPVPPPVLPLHQMDTLATAALLEKAYFSSTDIKLFEDLLASYGPRFHEIAAHLGKPVEHVNAFFYEHQAHYEGFLHRIESMRMMQSAPPIMAPNMYGSSAGPAQGVFNGPSAGVFAPRNEHTQVIQQGMQQPIISPVVQPPQPQVGMEDRSQNAAPQTVPPPVLPLELDTTNRFARSESEASAHEASLPSSDSAYVPPTPSPSNDHSNYKAKCSRLEVWPEFASVKSAIPPVLPRSLDRQVSPMKSFSGLSVYEFDGFCESNERQ